MKGLRPSNLLLIIVDCTLYCLLHNTNTNTGFTLANCVGIANSFLMKVLYTQYRDE